MGQIWWLMYQGGLLSIHVGAQVAASNAEMLERKKADVAERAAEDRRIVAYLHDKAAREQVGFCFGVRVRTGSRLGSRLRWAPWRKKRGLPKNSDLSTCA